MGGNGASSLASQVARNTGLTRQQVLTQATNLVNSGIAPNMTRAVQQILLNNLQATSATDRKKTWANMSIAEEDQLRRSMGQTGYEAGRTGVHPWDKDYVATSKSYNVNQYLNTDQREYNVPWKDQNGKFISSWGMNSSFKENNPLRPSMGVKQIINKMDNGMKPTTRNLNLTRMESSAQTLDSFGINYSMRQLKGMTQQELTKNLYGATRGIKGYMSMTTNERGNRNDVFKGRDVIIEATVRQGVHGIMTNNRAEREFIVGRGYDQKITSARWEKVGGEEKLVIGVTITPNARSSWYNLK